MSNLTTLFTEIADAAAGEARTPEGHRIKREVFGSPFGKTPQRVSYWNGWAGRPATADEVASAFGPDAI